MKIAVAQLNFKVGAVHLNQKKISDHIERAKKEKADLIVFPELSLTGYPPRDLLDYHSLVDQNIAALDVLSKQCTGIAVLVGFVDRNPAKTGKRFFNAAALLKDGKIAATYHKRLLPYYDVFEDERYFEPGAGSLVFELCGARIGVSICEDAWNEAVECPYAQDPIQDYAGKIDLLVNLSASPFHLGKPYERLEIFQSVAARIGASVLCCNLVGANDELVFDGSSFLTTKDGAVCGTAPAFQESFSVWEWGKSNAIQPWPPEGKDGEGEWLFSALVTGVKDYAEKTGVYSAILGLSGGIDSSVVACVAAKALGPQAVLGLCLPSRFNASESLEDALTLATRLGMTAEVFSIEPIFETVSAQLSQGLGKAPKPLTLDNLQPRIRMSVLMAYANEGNRLLLNTSNKSEIATGYATLYGDTAGALSVLGDLKKSQVVAVARYLNQWGELITERVITRPPTAELRENQKDEDDLPAYPVLDGFVERFVDESSDPLDWGGSPDESKFLRLYAVSEYKRRQLPPALRVSRRAFGMGRRVPVASQKPSEK